MVLYDRTGMVAFDFVIRKAKSKTVVLYDCTVIRNAKTKTVVLYDRTGMLAFDFVTTKC